MPTVKKNVKFYKEQQELVNTLIKFLQLKDDNSFIIYEIDNNKTILNNIYSLSNSVKKYYNCNGISGITKPNIIKRPWLSIVRQVLKHTHKIITTDYRIYSDNKIIRTRKYFILNKDT